LTEAVPLSSPMGQRHRHSVCGPSKICMVCLGVKGVALGSRSLNQHLEFHAINQPLEEIDWSPRTLLEGARRDGCVERADLKGYRLVWRIDPVAGLAKDELRAQAKGVVVWLLVKIDRKLGFEAGEGCGRGKPRAREVVHHTAAEGEEQPPLDLVVP